MYLPFVHILCLATSEYFPFRNISFESMDKLEASFEKFRLFKFQSGYL